MERVVLSSLRQGTAGTKTQYKASICVFNVLQSIIQLGRQRRLCEGLAQAQQLVVANMNARRARRMYLTGEARP